MTPTFSQAHAASTGEVYPVKITVLVDKKAPDSADAIVKVGTKTKKINADGVANFTGAASNKFEAGTYDVSVDFDGKGKAYNYQSVGTITVKGETDENDVALVTKKKVNYFTATVKLAGTSFIKKNAQVKVDGILADPSVILLPGTYGISIDKDGTGNNYDWTSTGKSITVKGAAVKKTLTYRKVSFNINSTTTQTKAGFKDQYVINGGKIVKLADPKLKGYEFAGWYTGSKKAPWTTKFNIGSQKVTKDITLNAAYANYGIFIKQYINGNLAKYTKNSWIPDGSVIIGKSFKSAKYKGATGASPYTGDFSSKIDPKTGIGGDSRGFLNGTYNVYNDDGIKLPVTITVKDKDSKVAIRYSEVHFYDSTGSNDAETVLVVPNGSKISLPMLPSKTGYKAKGWFYAKSGGEQFISNKTKVVTKTALYPQYTKIAK
jgi:hypothetical protein